MDKSTVAKQLNTINDELFNELARFGELCVEKDKQRANIYDRELLDNSSASRAEQVAFVNTIDLSNQVTRSKQKILRLEAHRDHLRFLIKYNMESYI